MHANKQRAVDDRNYLLYSNNVCVEEDARAWNTDGVRVDKDLFKAGCATPNTLCTSSFYFTSDSLKILRCVCV